MFIFFVVVFKNDLACCLCQRSFSVGTLSPCVLSRVGVTAAFPSHGTLDESCGSHKHKPITLVYNVAVPFCLGWKPGIIVLMMAGCRSVI